MDDLDVDGLSGVIDHGDRLEIRALAGLERTARTGAGALGAIAGGAILVLVALAPGMIVGSAAAGAGVGVLLLAGGLVAVATARRYLEVDDAGVTLHGLVRSRTVQGPRIDRVLVEEHAGTTSGTFSRRVGGMRIGLGSDRGGMDLLGSLRWRRSVVTIEFAVRGAGDLVIGLRALDLDEARYLVDEICRRAHLPDALEVEVNSERASS